MKKKLQKIQRFPILNTQYSILLSIFCSLFSILSFSQTYQWQWAKSGGGNLRLTNESNGQVGVRVMLQS